ncbi:MAG: hypothetical protein ACM37Z_09955 [Deltaproteobacteria bacterium]
MNIVKGANVAVVVNRHWANLQGVRMFLRPEREIEGRDESHVVFARMLDSEDDHGLWIELNTAKHEQDPAVKRFQFLIPWSQVISVVVAEEFSAAIQEQAQKIAFGFQAKN